MVSVVPRWHRTVICSCSQVDFVTVVGFLFITSVGHIAKGCLLVSRFKFRKLPILEAKANNCSNKKEHKRREN